jgi:hypothetical protein
MVVVRKALNEFSTAILQKVALAKMMSPASGHGKDGRTHP